MKYLKQAWREICDPDIKLDVPASRWKHAWSTHELSAKRLYNAVRWRRPQILVETGTFEGLGTWVMAKAASENGNRARIFTIDYDGDPDISIPEEDWKELRKLRDENLANARRNFPDVEINFLNGDSRTVLPQLVPSRIEHWDFFFQDSMHFFSGIMAEWEIMRAFARRGSVVVFDDICLDWKKLPRYFFKRNDFCLRFVLSEARRDGWVCESTSEGRAQFWAQKCGR